MADPHSSQPPTGRASRVTTLVIANGLKVVGAYLIVVEQQGMGRSTVLIVGALLALGAQTVETVVLRAIDRFFGREESRP